MFSDDQGESSSCWSAESPKKKRVRRTLSAVANDFSFDEDTQKYCCSHCEKQYVSKAVVRQHLVNIHDCSTTLANKEKSRKLRVRRILTAIANDWFFNEEAQKFECNYCTKQSQNKVRIRVHLEDCHKDKIPGSVTKGKNIHMKRESRNVPSHKRKERKPHEKRPPVANDYTYDNLSNVYCCKHCDRIFSSTGGVRKHLADKHDPSIGEELKIEHCDASTSLGENSSTSYQITNSPSKSKSESSTCQMRKKIRKQRPPVANNYSYDSENKSYCCDHCERKFSTSRAARKHLVDKHDPDQGVRNYELQTETVWLKPIEKIDKNKCKDCSREFLAREGLDNHWNAEHNPENALKCDYCASGFCKDLTSLENHLKFHSYKPTPGAYHCIECLKVFSTAKQYYHHMQTHREKRFACDLCGFRFQFKLPLFRHLYSHFRALNPHVKVPAKPQEDLLCSQCSAMIKRHQMSRHMATHHSVSRPLKCDRNGCKYSCFELRQLVEHKNTHSQIRPHKCEICDKGFNHLGGLRMHRLRHTDPDKFKCEICQNCFVTGESLKKHKLSKHSDDPDLDPSLVPHPFACDYEGCQSTFRFSAALKRHTITVHNSKFVHCMCLIFNHAILTFF